MGACLLFGPGAGAGAVPPTSIVVHPNVPATATDLGRPLARNSPVLAADPTDPRFVVMAARVDAPSFGCALSVSGDGGQGWVGAAPLSALPLGAEACYAPQIAFDRSGRLYFLFVGLHTAGNTPMGVFLSSSTDRARTFSTPRKILGANAFGVRLAIDTTAGKRGRIHVVWLQANSTPGLGSMPPGANPIVAAHSDDGGRTFSTPTPVSTDARRRVVAPALALDPNHQVNVVYYDLGDDGRDYQGLDGPTWEGAWSLVSARSTDGGTTFTESGTVDDAIVPSARVLLIFTMPSAAVVVDRHSRLYVAWDDDRNGDPDVLLRRSEDDGRSWTPAQRLNDDRTDSLTDQYLPKLSVAPNGRIDAVFYDRRNDRDNISNDVYYTWSVDGGQTFAPNVRITQASSLSRIGPRYPLLAYAQGRVEFGSSPAMLSTDDGGVAAWADTRLTTVLEVSATTGPTAQEIFTSRISLQAGSPSK